MDGVTIELTIKGNIDEIFDFKENQNNSTSRFYPLNCNYNLRFDTDDGNCFVSFETICLPTKSWLENLVKEYPSFIVNTFWYAIDLCKISSLGYIEEDGTEHEEDTFDQRKTE
jgi:hypothetical protein